MLSVKSEQVSVDAVVKETVAARRCRVEAMLQRAPGLFDQPRPAVGVMTSDYYQAQHDRLEAYRTNNWLVPYVPAITATRPRSVLEIGCGNGKATRLLAAHVAQVHALDWARSPEIDHLPANVAFLEGDVCVLDLPSVDCVASADVLEHFPPDALMPLIERLASCSRRGLHVIACYDDGHSHLSIGRPAHWLALFQAISPDYSLLDVIHRRGDDRQVTCTISNL